MDARVPERVFAWVKLHIHSPGMFLLAVNLLLVVVGTLLDEFSSVVLLAPLLAPVGLNLFLASSLFEKPLAKVAR